MTDKLPILTGKEVVKVLKKLGYTINDQKGSHIHMRHPVRRPLTVPNHPEIALAHCELSLRMQISRLKNFWSYYDSRSLQFL